MRVRRISLARFRSLGPARSNLFGQFLLVERERPTLDSGVKKRQSSRNLSWALVVAALLSPTASDGASITWGSATDGANTADVSTTGNPVEAFNLAHTTAAASTVTVNGVTFTGLASPSPLTNTNSNPPAQLNGNSTGDADPVVKHLPGLCQRELFL